MKTYILNNKQTNTTTLVNGTKELAQQLNCTRQLVERLITHYDTDFEVTIKDNSYTINLIDASKYDERIAYIKTINPSILREGYNRQINYSFHYTREDGYYLSLDPNGTLKWYNCWSKKAAIQQLKEDKEQYITVTKELWGE